MTLFNNWCQQEGVLMPKLQYPYTFEGGLTGVKVIEEIATIPSEVTPQTSPNEYELLLH